jgi:hypothetical protein
MQQVLVDIRIYLVSSNCTMPETHYTISRASFLLRVLACVMHAVDAAGAGGHLHLPGEQTSADNLERQRDAVHLCRQHVQLPLGLCVLACVIHVGNAAGAGEQAEQ